VGDALLSLPSLAFRIYSSTVSITVNDYARFWVRVDNMQMEQTAHNTIQFKKRKEETRQDENTRKHKITQDGTK
jgi:hypothetical protein